MAVNFYDLCRVCTAKSEHKVNVFSAEGKRRNLCAKVAECLDLNIDAKDRLPKVICSQCVQNVESNIEFRDMCKNSQATLTSWLNAASGDKVYIKDERAFNTGRRLNILSNTCVKGIMPFNVVQNTPHQPTILQGNDLLSSFAQCGNLQQQTINVEHHLERHQPLQQFKITVENNSGNTIELETNKNQEHQSSQIKDKESKTNTLEEFLKMKPNIKVTPIKKDFSKHQQPLSEKSTSQQTSQQTTSHVPQQLNALQLIQQQLQQQWQQQQIQQQLQHFTQLQPQQITLTAPTPTCITTSENTNTSTSINDLLSPSKSNKAKINLVLTPSSCSQTAALAPELTATTSSATSSQQQPHIQLQFQPAVTSIQQHQQLEFQHQHQEQAHSNSTNFLSNFSPFLQQSVGVRTPIGPSTTTNLLSPNKCFFPITIKDENSDQQIVAHIDAKNFVLPTTYQLQMKLQPQIATVDGQPIIQLAPSSIPATLQLTPQAISNQTLQTLLNTSNNIQQTQIMQTQEQPTQVQLTHQNFKQQQSGLKPQIIQKQLQSFQPIITSQQVIKPTNIVNNYMSRNVRNDASMSTNEQHCKEEEPKLKMQAVAQQKYNITQLPGNNIEVTSQAITDVEKVQCQQIQALKTSSLPQSVPTQYGGITVQRIQTTAKMPVSNKRTHHQDKQQATTISLPSTVTKLNNATNVNVWNKQNVTISRISTQKQTQTQPQKQSQNNQQQQKTVQCKVSMPQNQQLIKIQEAVEESETAINDPSKTLGTIASKKTDFSTEVSQQGQTQNSHVTSASTTQSSVVDRNDKIRNIASKLVASSAKIVTTKTLYTTSAKSNANESKEDSAKYGDIVTDNANTSLTAEDYNNTKPVGFICNQCQRVFKKKEHLTQHVKLHAGIRPFKCTQDGCDKDFNRKEHLLRHLISHTGQKMFNCDVCQKLFSRKDNLNKHKRIHSQTANNYICDMCNKSFTVKAYFQEHIAMHNKQESTAASIVKKSHESSQTHTGQQIQMGQNPQQDIQQPMHLHMSTVVATQDIPGNNITIAQSNDVNKSLGCQDGTVLNIPSHLDNLVQFDQTQFGNSSTGEMVRHISMGK